MTENLPDLIEIWETPQSGLRASHPVDDEAALVVAARHDSAAFAALYRRYVAPIYRYLYSRVDNAADAQDLTAQVFLETLESLPRYRERGNFAAWLFTIARRRATDYYRRRPLVTLDDETAAPDDKDLLSQAIHREALDRLRALIQGLDEDQRELLRLRFAAGLTFSQMGQVLGRKEGAVKMALRRLLDRLKVTWGVER